MGQLQPGAVIGRAWDIYRDQAGILIPAALAIFAVEAVAALVLPGVLAILAAVVSIVLTVFYQGMVVQLVRDVQDGRRDNSVADLFRSVAPVAGSLLVVAILFGLGVGIGFVLLIIPGLFLLTIWAVAAPVTVIERPGILRAFGRSRELVRGYGWPVFGVIVLVFLLTVAVGIVAGLIGAPLGDAGRTIVQWVVSALLEPLAALVSSVLYFTLREVRGETAAAAPATEPVPPDAPERPAPGTT
jgi:hypothetical protein